MSNIRLFFQESLSLNLSSKLDKYQSHYINKVMRIKVSGTFSLFNSSGEWEAIINEISKGLVKFTVIKHLRHKESSKEIWLAFSPIKSNYFNFMIQKSTELGITRFFPIIFDRTIVRKINKQRLEKVIIEAAEQSNRINIAKIEKPQNLKSFLSKNKSKVNLIFTDLYSKNKKLDVNKLANKPICIIIGPEGDFSEAERKAILSYEGVNSFKVNENILRSETAAISAISIVSYFTNL